MTEGLYPNVYRIVARRTQSCYVPFPYSVAPVHIGLFTEQNSTTQGGLAATVEALVAHRPQDATIHRYCAPGNLAALLYSRDIMIRAAADRIDLVHITTTGPLSIVALLVATRFGLPVIGSFPCVRNASDVFKTYLRTLIRQSRRL